MNETISLAMIVRNEEDVLTRCLDSVKDYVDEIIIVDTGSTDKSIEISKNYTDKTYTFKWIDDFAQEIFHLVNVLKISFFGWMLMI